MPKFATFLMPVALMLLLGANGSDNNKPDNSNMTLSAQKTAEDPSTPDHKFWDSASGLDLQTASNDPEYEAEPFIANVKAAYDDSSLYLYLKWPDPTKTESVMKNWWKFDGSKWSKSGDEDRVGILWPISDSKGFNSSGCVAVCHAAPKNSENVNFLMRAEKSEKFDEWHWKASRTNISSHADDSWMDDSAKEPSQPKWDEAAHHSDAGESVYIPNEGGLNDGPKYAFNGMASFDRSGRFLAQKDAVEIAGNLIAGKKLHDQECITCHVGPTTLENRKISQYLPAYELKEFLEAGGPNHQGPALQPEDANNTMAYLQTMPSGIPGYLLKSPTASRSDIKASGLYKDNAWQLVLKRDLQTKNDDDVQFDISKEYPFGLAIMDNSEKYHSIIPLLKLKFRR